MKAQPAPVTPPPEWATKAADEIAKWANEDNGRDGACGITTMSVRRILAKHAPPPAPESPTEQGELVERLDILLNTLKGERDRITADEENEQFWQLHILAVKDAITALSRQPAPSGEQLAAMTQFAKEEAKFNGVLKTQLAARDEEITEHRAHIASLEAERRKQSTIIAHWQKFAGKCSGLLGCSSVDDDILKAIAQLRAAPSAVAGGGEDAKLDEEAAALVLAHALADKEGGDRYRNLRDYNHAQWFMRVTSDMFDAAIAATKAKEENHE